MGSKETSLEFDDFVALMRSCRLCHDKLPLGSNPIFQLHPSAPLLIIGQAPGTHAHHSGCPFNDASGERLRQWLGMSDTIFYDPLKVAIVPMGLCYPGRYEKGGDKPPSTACAPKWHQRVLDALPKCRLILLVGRFAQAYYLKNLVKPTVAETVQCWQNYYPPFFPLPHPSWRTKAWCKQNPWFESKILPTLQEMIRNLKIF